MIDWTIVLIFILVGLNVLQFIYWGRLYNQAVDKLMSKNYADYVTAKNYPKTLVANKAKTDEDQAELDRQNQSILNELNGLLGS